MQIFEEIGPLQNAVTKLKCESKKIGLVPTMGSLHEGHAALIKSALQENDYTICSIFVNPTQFDNPEDLEKYPRDIEKDLSFLKSLDCDGVFIPSVPLMYPSPPSVQFSFGSLEYNMEGSHGKGHFPARFQWF